LPDLVLDVWTEVSPNSSVRKLAIELEFDDVVVKALREAALVDLSALLAIDLVPKLEFE
jgi:hypothetical protein